MTLQDNQTNKLQDNKINVNKARKVEPLRDFDEEIYKKALIEKDLDTYENEIALSDGTLSIPKEITTLPLKAQYVLAFYCDRAYINKITNKRTYNDILESYIASLDDDSFLEDVFLQVPITDQNGNVIKMTTVVNNEKKNIYMKLQQQAYSFWNDNNLLPIVDIFKKLKSGGRKKEDELKEAIVDDALYHEDENIKLKNRSLAIKVMGMDKNVQTSAQNVWLTGGGKDFGKALANFTGKKGFDITEYVEVETLDRAKDKAKDDE